MPGDVNGLARFRADPEKVRIALRRIGPMWVATIEERVSGSARTGWHRYAYRAVVLALQGAERARFDGVDLSMSWSFFHPWSTCQQRAHYAQSLTPSRQQTPERK